MFEAHPKFVFYVPMEWKDLWPGPIQSCLDHCLPTKGGGWVRTTGFWSLEQNVMFKTAVVAICKWRLSLGGLDEVKQDQG